MTTSKSPLRDPGAWVAVAFGTVLTLPLAVFGLWGFYAINVRPVVTYLDAMSWRETPCTILSSRLVEEDDFHKVDILYAYVVDGQVYRSDLYDFSGVHSSGGQEEKQAMVDRHPSGSRTLCYVDPDDPARAVLHPTVSTEAWWLGPVFLIFGLAGAGGLFGIYRGFLPARKTARKVKPLSDLAAPAELQPSPRRLTRFLRPALLALVWNYAVASFVLLVYRNLRAERPVSAAAWLLLPLALIGLVLLILAVRRMFVVFNPRPRLILSPQVVQRGKTADLQWWFSGDARRVQRLRIVLEGRKTRRDEPYELVLVDSTEPERIAESQASFTVPLGAIPSVWNLRVTTEVAAGPDFVDNFDIPVKL